MTLYFITRKLANRRMYKTLDNHGRWGWSTNAGDAWTTPVSQEAINRKGRYTVQAVTI